MHKLKVLLTSGLIAGTCLLSAVPAMAATTAVNPNAQYWTQIKQLRQTDTGLGEQLTGLRQGNNALRKSDWTQKNYTALLSAKNDQITFENNYIAALTDRFTLQKDTIQLQIDRQAKNETAITTDLQNIITDLNNQISIRTTLVSDAQKVQADLGGSSTTPSTAAPTTTSADGAAAQ